MFFLAILAPWRESLLGPLTTQAIPALMRAALPLMEPQAFVRQLPTGQKLLVHGNGLLARDAEPALVQFACPGRFATPAPNVLSTLAPFAPMGLTTRRQERKEEPAKKTGYGIAGSCRGRGGSATVPRMSDGLSKQYAELPVGSYDCDALSILAPVDRIVWNTHFRHWAWPQEQRQLFCRASRLSANQRLGSCIQMMPITSARSGARFPYCQSLVVGNGFARAAHGSTVENLSIWRGAQRVMLAGLHPHPHLRNPIQFTWRKSWKRIPVEVFARPAPLARIPKQGVQDGMGENQRLRLRCRDRRCFQGGTGCEQALPRSLFPGLRRCRRGLVDPLTPPLRRRCAFHSCANCQKTELAANLPTHAASLLEKLRHIFGRLFCHANGPFALSALRRLGRVRTPWPRVAGVTAVMRRRSQRKLRIDSQSGFRRWREGKVRPIRGNAPHAPAGKPGFFFTALKERLRRSLTRHTVTATANKTGAPNLRFLRHGGI